VRSSGCIVHLLGGSAPRIAEVLRGSALEHALQHATGLLAESGAAMALGAWALGCPATVDPPTRGLGWFPTWVIDAHFAEPARRARLASTLALNPTLRGLGLEASTALLVEGRALEAGRAIGSGQVHLLGNGTPRVLPGDGSVLPVSETRRVPAAAD
jgi:cyanophycinase-like exopeptidase